MAKCKCGPPYTAGYGEIDRCVMCRLPFPPAQANVHEYERRTPRREETPMNYDGSDPKMPWFLRGCLWVIIIAGLCLICMIIAATISAIFGLM